jgi:hypothetical protein
MVDDGTFCFVCQETIPYTDEREKCCVCGKTCCVDCVDLCCGDCSREEEDEIILGVNYDRNNL